MGRGQAAALGRRDAVLYLVAAALGSFGLGVASFYLNFLNRALGFAQFGTGRLAGAHAIGVVAGSLPAAVFTRGRSRRGAILLGGTVTGVGIFGILVFNALLPLLGSAMLVGFGGIIASSSGAALLADATVAARRATRFGQQIALGTTAAFLSSAIAGALATPVAALLGARPDDALVLRALVASGGIIAAASIAPVLAIRAVPVGRHTLEAPTRNHLVRRFLVIEVLFGFGAGSFLPFLNLFFADRYGVPFSALGLLLGVLAVAGSIGALLHGRFVAARIGAIPSIVLVEMLSLPFALVAAFTGALPIAAGELGWSGGDGEPIKVERPENPDHGDYATSVALRLARPVRKPPRDIAEAIRERVKVGGPIASVEALNGFVNIRVDLKWLASQVDEIVQIGRASCRERREIEGGGGD